MRTKVVKFGGSSLADAEQIRKVAAIIQAQEERRYVVPSAPGKRRSGDHKITDLLYICHAHVEQDIPFDDVYNIICKRYLDIARELGIRLNLAPYLKEIRERILTGASADYTASRGEFLNGLILADLLGYTFIDAAEVICFDGQGHFDPETTQHILSAKLSMTPRAVIPGFYGARPDGEIKTFSRGGSDITGAIVARACGAELYENWTDVSGFLMADPRIVENPRPIDSLSYRELRELSYMGASVLHEESIFPVKQAGIPILIKNTNRPEDPGTKIIAEHTGHAGTITGVAGHKGFTIISMEKAMLNQEVGIARRLLSVLEDMQISFEHMPSGIDTICIIIADKELGEHKLDRLLSGIRNRCQPDRLDISTGLALVATVGHGMARTPGVSAKLFNALYEAGVNVRMIDQGSSEMNIIVGVDNQDFEESIRAIYGAFVKE